MIFSISFVDDLHTFLLDNNIDPQNEKRSWTIFIK